MEWVVSYHWYGHCESSCLSFRSKSPFVPIIVTRRFSLPAPENCMADHLSQKQAFGRPVRNMKKFEEGVFSDLRNLKPGVDACLEEPKVNTRISFFGTYVFSRFL